MSPLTDVGLLFDGYALGMFSIAALVATKSTFRGGISGETTGTPATCFIRVAGEAILHRRKAC